MKKSALDLLLLSAQMRSPLFNLIHVCADGGARPFPLKPGDSIPIRESRATANYILSLELEKDPWVDLVIFQPFERNREAAGNNASARLRPSAEFAFPRLASRSPSLAFLLLAPARGTLVHAEGGWERSCERKQLLALKRNHPWAF